MTPEEKARLLHSGLMFRRGIQAAADDLLLQMVANNDAFGAVPFSTENNRPCLLVLAIGEDMVKYVQAKLKQTPKE